MGFQGGYKVPKLFPWGKNENSVCFALFQLFLKENSKGWEETFQWQSFLIQILTNGSDIQTSDAVVCSATDADGCSEILYFFPFDFDPVPLHVGLPGK